MNQNRPPHQPDLVINIKTFFEHFQNFIVTNNKRVSDYIKNVYYPDINKIIQSIIKYWIPLYNPGSEFYQFYYTIEPILFSENLSQIFVIIPGIEEFITECKFIASAYGGYYPNDFWKEFTYQFGNYTKDQLKIRLEKNNISIIFDSIKKCFIIGFYNFKY